MADIVLQRDVGSYLTHKVGLGSVTLTAGSTATDAVAQTGTGVDRLLPRYGSAVLSTIVTYSLAAGKTVAITRAINDSPDGSTYTTYGTPPTDVVVGSTSSTAAQTGSTVIMDKVDLSGANEYIRCAVTGNLSATATDTAVVTSLWTFSGNDRN